MNRFSLSRSGLSPEGLSRFKSGILTRVVGRISFPAGIETKGELRSPSCPAADH